ncbi:hypothetical protein Ga0074812_101137 [Parafrankia irregularis]|uniref:Uncharacterized protein n=1 Tax=Parafrankia irregularis TaxID=795642 RepID=A0A0S4QDY8_9ACTN|nr:hypothetical protein Ga0074812_101137 [Parafrankia irregularis]
MPADMACPFHPEGSFRTSSSRRPRQSRTPGRTTVRWSESEIVRGHMYHTDAVGHHPGPRRHAGGCRLPDNAWFQRSPASSRARISPPHRRCRPDERRRCPSCSGPGGLDDLASAPGHAAARNTALTAFFEQAIVRAGNRQNRTVRRSRRQPVLQSCTHRPSAPAARRPGEVKGRDGFPDSLLDGTHGAQGHQLAEQLPGGLVGDRRKPRGASVTPHTQQTRASRGRAVELRVAAVRSTPRACLSPQPATARYIDTHPDRLFAW